MSKSLDFSLVPAELKRHVVTHPEVLRMVLKSDRSFLKYVGFVPNVIDRVIMNRLKMTNVAQPGGKNTFNPKLDALRPDPRYGHVKKCKVDLQFDEEDMEDLWKSYLGMLENRNPDSINDLPYEAVILDMILEQLKQDEHLESLFKGVRDDAGTDASDLFDGFLKHFADDITAGIIPAGNVFDGVAVTAANAVEQIEGVKGKVPDRFRNRDLVCVTSPTIKDYYDQDYRSTFGSLNYNNEFKKQFIDGTRIELVSEEALEGSQRITITPRYNLKYMTAGNGDMDKIKPEEFERNLKLMIDWRAGVNYSFPEYIWLNDQP